MFYFFFPSNHRVEFSFGGSFGKIVSEIVYNRCLIARRGIGTCGMYGSFLIACIHFFLLFVIAEIKTGVNVRFHGKQFMNRFVCNVVVVKNFANNVVVVFKQGKQQMLCVKATAVKQTHFKSSASKNFCGCR